MTDLATIQQLSAAGRHQDCLQACQHALQANQEQAYAYKYAGKSLLALGQFEKAQQCLVKAHQLDGSDPEIIKDIGNIFNALQNYAEAIRLYKAALSINQNYAPAINNLGLIAKRQGHLEAAEQLVKKARDLDQSFAPYHMNLGWIYKDLGQLDDALAATLKSLELKPDNPDAHMNLGGIYKDLGKLDQALAYTLKSLELKPDNPDAHINLGEIYKDLGQLDDAHAATMKSLELKPDNPTAQMNLGGIYKELGQLDQALASTLKSIELKPDNPTAHMNMGGIYQELGQLDQALAATMKSLELKPDNPTAHMNLGGIYKELGQLDQALDSTLKYLELKPDNPDAHMNLGAIYKDLGKLDQALAATLKSLELKPDNPTAHMNLGGIYKDLGDIEGSRKQFKEGYKIKPSLENMCKAYLTFDEIYEDIDHIKEQRDKYLKSANEIFEKFTEIDDNTSFLDFSLFMLAYHNGQDDKEFMKSLGEIVRPTLDLISKEKGNVQTIKSEKKGCSKIRIGFYFDNPQKEHAVFSHFFNIVKACAEEGFEILIIKGPIAACRQSEDLDKIATKTIQLTSKIRKSIEDMKDLKMDLLVYTEMHSSKAPYCLAINRIAPIQIILPGNPMTSGLSTIDYYLSSSLTEPEDAEKNYSENLIQLSGIPTGIDESFIEKATSSREALNLPLDKSLIGLLHNPIKYHPDMDRLLEEIAHKNPNAVYVTSKGQKPGQIKCIVERWKKFAPKALSQTIFIDRIDKNNYLQILGNLDLLLDPVHRGCGTTAFDAMSVGVPVVTMPGDHSRSRLIAGIYKGIGLKNAPIASDSEEYVYWCNEIASSATLRDELRSSILSGFSRLTKLNKLTTQETVSFFKDAAKASIAGEALLQSWKPYEEGKIDI